MTLRDVQRELFAPSGNALPPAVAPPEHHALALRLPLDVHLGTTSWSYPGWAGTVYGTRVSEKDLARYGLTAYAQHPLLRAVEIDRTYYEPLSATALRSFADQVPDDFRFVVKAHEDCVTRRFPAHARYGKKRGESNARYLDASYAADTVVAPFKEGLGAKGGALLFQFPPREANEPDAFAEQLHGFLRQLPKDVLYAVELRNAELLVPSYSAALEDAGAVHCHNAWSEMPSLAIQAKSIAPRARRPFLARWLLRQGDTFERARARYAPFDRLVDVDETTRALIAGIVAKAHAHDVPALVVVDNKAEGCAPTSVARLAEAIVERCSQVRRR
jgi:uncharacterized protein YecE (DUF72 family)